MMKDSRPSTTMDFKFFTTLLLLSFLLVLHCTYLYVAYAGYIGSCNEFKMLNENSMAMNRNLKRRQAEQVVDIIHKQVTPTVIVKSEGVSSEQEPESETRLRRAIAGHLVKLQPFVRKRRGVKQPETEALTGQDAVTEETVGTTVSSEIPQQRRKSIFHPRGKVIGEIDTIVDPHSEDAVFKVEPRLGRRGGEVLTELDRYPSVLEVIETHVGEEDAHKELLNHTISPDKIEGAYDTVLATHSDSPSDQGKKLLSGIKPILPVEDKIEDISVKGTGSDMLEHDISPSKETVEVPIEKTVEEVPIEKTEYGMLEPEKRPLQGSDVLGKNANGRKQDEPKEDTVNVRTKSSELNGRNKEESAGNVGESPSETSSLQNPQVDQPTPESKSSHQNGRKQAHLGHSQKTSPSSIEKVTGSASERDHDHHPQKGESASERGSDHHPQKGENASERGESASEHGSDHHHQKGESANERDHHPQKGESASEHGSDHHHNQKGESANERDHHPQKGESVSEQGDNASERGDSASKRGGSASERVSDPHHQKGESANEHDHHSQKGESASERDRDDQNVGSTEKSSTLVKPVVEEEGHARKKRAIDDKKDAVQLPPVEFPENIVPWEQTRYRSQHNKEREIVPHHLETEPIVRSSDQNFRFYPSNWKSWKSSTKISSIDNVLRLLETQRKLTALTVLQNCFMDFLHTNNINPKKITNYLHDPKALKYAEVCFDKKISLLSRLQKQLNHFSQNPDNTRKIPHECPHLVQNDGPQKSFKNRHLSVNGYGEQNERLNPFAQIPYVVRWNQNYRPQSIPLHEHVNFVPLPKDINPFGKFSSMQNNHGARGAPAYDPVDHGN